MRDHIKWAYEKADLHQQRKAQFYKWNYDQCSKAVSLRLGDTVLVHVTTFKCRHKIQSQWENRDYVVELHSYPNLPVYVVCPIDGEGHSYTLHRYYLLPINSNLEQGECENSMGGDYPVMNQLWYPIRMMHCQLTPKWKSTERHA